MGQHVTDKLTINTYLCQAFNLLDGRNWSFEHQNSEGAFALCKSQTFSKKFIERNGKPHTNLEIPEKSIEIVLFEKFSVWFSGPNTFSYPDLYDLVKEKIIENAPNLREGIMKYMKKQYE